MVRTVDAYGTIRTFLDADAQEDQRGKVTRAFSFSGGEGALPEPTSGNVGRFEFEVYGAGRGGRHRCSRFQLRCDALGLHDNQILLLSAVGPETSVKALAAGLRSSSRDQQPIIYSGTVGPVQAKNLMKCHGYRVYRSKLEYCLWQILCLAQRESFLPVLSEEAVFQHRPCESP